SLAAAKATIHELRDQQVPKALRERGAQLKQGYNQLASARGMDFTRAVGLESRTLIQFDAAAADPLLQKSQMQQELLRHGVLWSGFHNLSFSHRGQGIAHIFG